MATGTVHQSDLSCAQCGGQQAYSPAHQALECLHCGTLTRLETDADHLAAAERIPGRDQDTLQERKTLAHRCDTCGGIVTLAGAVLSDRCAYCDGPVVRGRTDNNFETMALIPFRVPRADAQTQAQKWIRARVAAPRRLAEVVAKARVAGLYVPFWTFDSEEIVDYLARYEEGGGEHSRMRALKGQTRIAFDDLLVPASHHVTPLIRDGILHEFDPRRLRPYLPGYLAGFAAEMHHQSVEEGIEASARDKDHLIRNHIRAQERKEILDISYKTHITGLRYRRILLPVWMLHYQFEGRPYRVAVCGIHARAFGERPLSRVRLALMSAVLSGLAIALGFAWGSAGVF